MLPVIDKLLILQDRDRQILRLQDELSRIDPERQQLQAKLASSQSTLEAGKHKAKQIESDRKKLELEVEAKKQLIERYSLQQFQTKKNDEYRALAHEIDTARGAIMKLEDQQLDLMEQSEAAQKQVAAATRTTEEAKGMADKLLADLLAREDNLKRELQELESNRSELANAVDETVLP